MTREGSDLKALRQETLLLRQGQEDTIRILAAAVALRDGYTAHHVRRVSSYAETLFDRLAPGKIQASDMLGFVVHDIGKIGIPDRVLLKKGPLTRNERTVMRKHTIMGEALIQNLVFLRPAMPVVRHHHERWDGDGYPDNLAGHEIPLAARVLAVADSFDAATSDRPYRKARPMDEAVADIMGGAGRAYDPEVIEAFEHVISTGELSASDQGQLIA